MADEYWHTNHQKLAPFHDTASPSNFPSLFLYKVMAILVFLAVLPFLQSQALVFINKASLTGSWELLHLLFVGIAVSYGLFSRSDDENEKDWPASKIHNPQSYVSKFHQVSSVFDDEVESPSSSDESKVQTWSSLYHRNEPVVVLAEEHPRTTTRVGEKPLPLPVRSLKSRVSDPDFVEDSGFEFVLISSSNLKTSSKRFSEKLIERKNEVAYDEDVLQSPIRKRSTSGRKDAKKEVNGLPMEASIPKAAENTTMVRKKTLSPPPPLPPPPPLASNKSNFDFNNNGVTTKPIDTDSGEEIKRKNPVIGGSQRIKKAETEEEEEEERGVENQNKGSSMQRDNNGGIAEKKESVSKSGRGGDVDKQAEEFITKFREQIIESIKR